MWGAINTNKHRLSTRELKKKHERGGREKREGAGDVNLFQLKHI